MSAFYNVDQPPFNMGSVARAIAAANNGLLFDPSDMTTLYQDAAGTIPVTAVEQPVGKILDKSGNGNHATQSVTASRPVLSARKNVLLATETLATQSVTSVAAQYTLSFTGTGSVTLSGTATGTLTGTGVNDRVSLTITPTAGTLTLTVSGGVTKAQLELGAVAGPYQRVNTATDYDTDERYFPKYLRFDGVDDYLNLPYMGLYAGGSASVVAAITVSPSTWSTILAEGGDLRGLYILARYTGTNKLGTFIYNNANLLQNIETPITPGITTVLSVVDAGSAVTHWVSSRLTGSSNYTRSGTPTNAVTLVGARPPWADTLNGNLYSLIITKSALTDAQRIKCERYAASKAGVIL